MARVPLTVNTFQPNDNVWCLNRSTETISSGLVREVVVDKNATTTSISYQVQLTSLSIEKIIDSDTYGTVDDALAALKLILTT